MKVGGDFRLEKTTFEGKDKEINLDRINVGGTFHFYNSTLDGRFILSGSSMNELECNNTHSNNAETRFEDKGKTQSIEANANFYNIKVNGNANFREGTSFGGLANFERADIGKNLELTDAQFNNDTTFSSMKVGGNAIFNKTKFEGGFDMSNVEVVGTLSFHKTEAGNACKSKTFLGMKVGTFVFDPAKLVKYSLQGADYRLLNPTSENYEESLKLINDADYSHSTFTNLEAYYRRSGMMKAADEVYVAGKYKEGNSFEWPWRFLNRFMYVVVGYGKHLELALVWSLIFIVIGSLVFFSEENMLLDKNYEGDHGKPSQYRILPLKLRGLLLRAYRYFVKLKTKITQFVSPAQNEIYFDVKPSGKKQTDHKYNPLWYSIALFLPIVDLEDVKIWTPHPKCKWRRHYMRVHVILGYLLIPIGLAAWTGLIK